MPILEYITRGAARTRQEQEAIERGWREQADAVAEVEVNQKSLGTVQRRLFRDNETAQERLNRLLGEAKTALKGTENEAAEFDKTVIRLNKDLQNGTGQFRKFKEKGDEAFGETAIGKVTKFAAGFASIHEAARLVTNEFRTQQELIDRRAAAQTTVAQARNEIKRNVTDDETARAAIEASEKLATQLNLPESVVGIVRC